MSHQWSERGIESNLSSTLAFENQPPRTELSYQSQFRDFRLTHGNIGLADHGGHSAMFTRKSKRSDLTARLGYQEVTEQRATHWNMLSGYETQATTLCSPPAYQVPRSGASGVQAFLEQGPTISWSMETLTAAQSQLNDDDDTSIGYSVPMQPAENMSMDYFGCAAQVAAPEHLIDAFAEPIPDAGSNAHSPGLTGDMDANDESSQHAYFSGYRALPSKFCYATYRQNMCYATRNNGHPASVSHQLSVQLPEQGFDHGLFRQESISPLREGFHNMQISSSPKIEKNRTDCFINYTLKDQKQLSEGVARSGSPKTKLKRKEKAKEKRKQLVQAVIDAISELDTDLDLNAVQEMVFDQGQGHHDSWLV